MNDFEEQGVNATAAGSEPVAQGQTPAQPDYEAVVNRLVEQRVSERFANLDTEVERRIQSQLAKRSNKAQKQFQEDKRAIERMAQRSGWDTERTQHEMDAALKAANVMAFGEEETEAAQAAPAANAAPQYVPQTQQRQTTEPSSQRQGNADTEFRAFVQSVYGFDPKEQGLDYSDVMGVQDANDARVQEFQRKARAMGAELDKRRANAESVKKGIDDYGHTGGLSSGSASPSRSRLEQATDRDEIMDIATDEEWDKMQRGRR